MSEADTAAAIERAIGALVRNEVRRQLEERALSTHDKGAAARAAAARKVVADAAAPEERRVPSPTIELHADGSLTIDLSQHPWSVEKVWGSPNERLVVRPVISARPQDSAMSSARPPVLEVLQRGIGEGLAQGRRDFAQRWSPPRCDQPPHQAKPRAPQHRTAAADEGA